MNVQALKRRIAALTREPPFDQSPQLYWREWFTADEWDLVEQATETLQACRLPDGQYDLRPLTFSDRRFVVDTAGMMLHRRRAREAGR